MKPVKFLGIVIVIITIFILGITTWPPWLSNGEAREIIRKNENFIENHAELDSIDEIEINIYHIPFGCYITTIEGAWFSSCSNGF